MKMLRIFVSTLLCLGGLAVEAQVTLNLNPSRELGHAPASFNPLHPSPSTGSPNLVEGRELYLPLLGNNVASGGVAIDTNAGIVYVADTGNNRVLGWYYNDSLGKPGSGPFPIADFVIGQSDRFSTFRQNPDANGLFLPSGLAVDAASNLYVIDSGNNRILRYPFNQTTADLVVGQGDFNRNLVNQGQAAPAASTINLGNGLPASLAFDQSGNLFFTDVGNHRVLRYAQQDLRPGNNGPSANLVLGQTSFTSATQGQPPSSTNLALNQLNQPVGVAVDAQGRVYVADNYARVLVFSNLVPGASASFVAGMLGTAPNPGQTVINNTRIGNAVGVFVTGDGRVGVVDTAFSRLMVFPAVTAWPQNPLTATAPSPQAPAGGIIPAANVDITIATLAHYQNGGNQESSSGTLNLPTFATFNKATNELFVVDSGNHRVLVMPQQASGFGAATRVLGQDDFVFTSPNLIEGREFQFNPGVNPFAAIVIDQNNHLYISDTYNNRVLGYKDVRSFKTGAPADLVLGQRDMKRSVCNYSNTSPLASTTANASSLCQPTGLALDSAGNLWVADYGNSRVLRFDSPYSVGPIALQPASVVLGQNGSFSTRTAGPANFGKQTQTGPYGLAMDTDSRLIVSDPTMNRVLIYENQGANWVRTKVLGQSSPTTCPSTGCGSGKGLDQMNVPLGIATDSGGNLYVADENNGRVLIFANTGFLQGSDAALNVITGLQNPVAVAVNGAHGTATEIAIPRSTGEIWIATGNSVLRFPNLDSIVANPGTPQPTYGITEAANTLALAQDQFGDLFVADATNRVVVHYPAVLAVNAATFALPSATSTSSFPLAPGMQTAICPALQTIAQACRADDPHQFGEQSATNTDSPNPYPLPTTLADVQVLLNGNPTPLFAVGPQQINFQVPMSTPLGDATLEVVQVSTQQTLGSFPMKIVQYLPGLFKADPPVHTSLPAPDPCLGPNGICYQVLANNQDGTLNSTANPAARGTVISLFGTGQGYVDSAPADGDLTPDAQIATSWMPQVIVGAQILDSQSGAVMFSGLAPGMVGIWRIDVKIPMTTPPGTSIVAVLSPNMASSNVRGILQFTIAVKQ